MHASRSNSVGARLLAAFSLAVAAGAASAATSAVTVQANADLYNAPVPGAFEGSNPIAINVAGLSSFTITNVVSTAFTLNGGGNFNDADGIGSAAGPVTLTGGAGLSGLSAPNAGFLAAVFVGATVSGTAPAALDFTTGTGTAFTSLSPLLQQAFFVGDGRTGDGTGATQTFVVPTGATTLYFGVADACNYSGSPSCYNDNGGSVAFNLNTVAAVPEPMTIALMLAGLGVVGASVRRRRG